ncbi:MAG: hypothetical protein HY363_03415 [Candidatus Aenigmarchaeota archaeon]|nr:hypothetical protein [Candidatus Aenigmarchaeota archaeon]
MKRYWLLVVLFAFSAAALRTYLAFSVQGFSDDASYLHLRNARNIMVSGVPIVHDSLVPREGVLFSLFDYLLAGVGFLMPVEIAAKVLSNVFFFVLVIVFFWLSFCLCRSQKAALFAAVVFASLPDITATFNSASGLLLAFVFLCVLNVALLRRSVLLYVVALVLFTFLHPSVILFVFSLGVSVLLMLSEKRVLRGEIVELVLFSVFFVLAVEMFVHAKLLAQGVQVLSAHVPEEVLSLTFTSLTILGAVAGVGLVTVFFMLLAVYRALVEKQCALYYMIGLLAVSSVLLWFKLVPVQTGMLFFVYAAVLLFGVGYADFMLYVQKTRMSNFSWAIHGSIVLFVISANVVQAFGQVRSGLESAPDVFEDDAASWIAQYAPSDVVILTVPARGEYLAYKTRRQVVLDTMYYAIPDAPSRYADVARLFATSLEIEAVSIMEKYGAGMVYSPKYVVQPLYLPGNCFSIAYSNGASVYSKSPLCSVRGK